MPPHKLVRPPAQTHLAQMPAKAPFTDEPTLVAGCRAGDPDAQHQLYERHCHQVYRLMSHMVGAEHADDLTQQVFLRVLQTIGQFRGQSALSTWLYRLATNEALQFLRRRSPQRTAQPLAVEPADHRASGQRRCDDREILELALIDLEPDLRAIFLLREVEQLSYYEIALALDIAEGTVASRLNRARRLLREWIGLRR